MSADLINYNKVSAGKVLLKMSGEDNDEQIASLETQLQTAAENLKKAQDNLQNFNAVAPSPAPSSVAAWWRGSRWRAARWPSSSPTPPA